MALKEQIQNDLKAALLSGNRFAAETLRGLKAAILNEEVAQGKRDEGITDEETEKIIAREVKKRNESATLYDANERPELADNERKEIAVIEGYLPQQLSETEIQKLVDDAITASGATTMQQMGQVIGAVKAKAGNSADGAIVARLVKQSLGQ